MVDSSIGFWSGISEPSPKKVRADREAKRRQPRDGRGSANAIRTKRHCLAQLSPKQDGANLSFDALFHLKQNNPNRQRTHLVDIWGGRKISETYMASG
jgi:hypothetical protein